MLAFLAAPLPFPARKTASPVFASQADLRQRVLFYISIYTRPFKFRIAKFIIFGIAKNSKHFPSYNLYRMEGRRMRTRKLELGTRNLIGARVTQLRLARGMKQVELLAQLQLRGVDLSIPALSLLEGQRRPVSDIELYALAEILGVSADELLGRTSV